MLGKPKDVAPTSRTEKDPRIGKNNISSTGKKKKAYQKTYHPVLKALQGRLEEWKDTSQQLERVLRSIANLRDRIYWESGCLNQMPERQQKEQKQQRSSWTDSGFRPSFSDRNFGHVLLKEDIHLALDHDLLQHEQMLSAVRSLVASLAQTVEDFGRRLDEWMLQNLMNQNNHVFEHQMSAMLKEQNALELAQEVYSLLALDLYWKQTMATRVFDSCQEKVLCGDTSGPNHSSFLADPRDVIKESCKELSRSKHKKLTSDLVNELLAIP